MESDGIETTASGSRQRASIFVRIALLQLRDFIGDGDDRLPSLPHRFKVLRTMVTRRGRGQHAVTSIISADATRGRRLRWMAYGQKGGGHPSPSQRLQRLGVPSSGSGLQKRSTALVFMFDELVLLRLELTDQH